MNTFPTAEATVDGLITSFDNGIATLEWNNSRCAETSTCEVTFYGQEGFYAINISCGGATYMKSLSEAGPVNITLAVVGSSEPPLNGTIEGK